MCCESEHCPYLIFKLHFKSVSYILICITSYFLSYYHIIFSSLCFSYWLCLLILPHDDSIFSLFLLWVQTEPGLFWESYNFWHLTWRGFPLASAGALGISFVLQPFIGLIMLISPSGELPPCIAHMTWATPSPPTAGVLILLTSKPFLLPTPNPSPSQASSVLSPSLRSSGPLLRVEGLPRLGTKPHVVSPTREVCHLPG